MHILFYLAGSVQASIHSHLSWPSPKPARASVFVQSSRLLASYGIDVAVDKDRWL